MWHTKKPWIVALLVALLVCVAVQLRYRPGGMAPVTGQLTASQTPGKIAKLYADPSITNYQLSLESYLQDQGYQIQFVDQPDLADVALIMSARASNDQPLGQTLTAHPSTLLGTEDIVEKAEHPFSYLHFNPDSELNLDQAAITAKLSLSVSPQPEQWTLKAIGDIIPSRTVYKTVTALNDQTAPYLKTKQYTADADLTLADLECPLSDNTTHLTEGMVFSAPTSAVKGLQLAGIDAVNLASNHTYNKGASVFADTLEALDQAKLPYFGGGKNQVAARTPLVLTVKGIKVALLGYSSIVGSKEAGATASGMATLSMAPWGPLLPELVAQMVADIKAAKAQADLVLVYYHWGAEYTHEANADQRTVAHQAIDAGADLILGTHPHWVQGIEWYKQKLITYSLGNFVFDQEWSTETKQGVILSATFSGKELIAASLKPYQIEEYYQPRFVSGITAQKILGDVFAHSWWDSN